MEEASIAMSTEMSTNELWWNFFSAADLMSSRICIKTFQNVKSVFINIFSHIAELVLGSVL